MRSRTSDTKLIGLFLDMLAAEQGAGTNTLDAYRRDLEDFSAFLARAGQDFAGAETQALRDYLADLDVRGFRSSSVARRLSAMRHLFRFLLNERIRSDDPAAILSGPEARPRPAEGAVDRRRRSAAGAGQGSGRRAASLCAATAARACGCIACSRCCTPPACGYRNWSRCRWRRHAATPRMIVVRGKGNKERLVPLNEPSRRAMADYLAAMAALKPDKNNERPRIEGQPGLEMAVSLVRRKRPPDAAAFRTRPEATRGGLRSRAAAGQPACAAARLREPPPAQRR